MKMETFSPVYFNCTTKVVLNLEFDLDKSFKEIFYEIDHWINEGSGWITESRKAHTLNCLISRETLLKV